MSQELKLRRGTTAEHAVFTGANGEVTVDTEKKTIVVHDGETPGGNPLLTPAEMEGALATRVGQVATIADLRALEPAFEEQAVNLSSYLDLPSPMSPLGGGVFIAKFGDYSAEVASDTLTGVYIAFPSDPTGASGAWVRKPSGFVTPEMFGAIGDGVPDDTAALQAMLDAGLIVDFGDASRSYKVHGTLMLRNGHTLRGEWPTITQTAVQTPLFDCIGKDSVSVNGLRLVGVPEASYVNSPTSQAIGIAADSATRLKVFGNIFKDFCYSPLMVGQPGEDITFAFNVVDGPGASILSDPNYRNTTGFTILGKNVTVHGNKIEATASGGIIGQLSENVVVSANTIHDIITEHGLYCDTGIFGLVINGNNIRNTVATGLKVQNYDAVGGNSGAVSITGNTISGVTAGDGILVINTGPTATPVRCKGLTITGNVISNVGQDGIAVRYADDANVTCNSIAVVGRNGLYFDQYSSLVATGNNVRQTQSQGIFDANGAGAKISNNKLEDVGRAGGTSAGLGIHITAGSEKEITGNTIRGNATLMEYGIFIEAGTQSTMSISGNSVSGSKTAPMRFKNPAEPLRYFADNVLDGEPLFLYNTIQLGNKGREYFGTAAPTSGSWLQGDRVYNVAPVGGGVIGWVCVASGTPGTWKFFGALEA